MIHLYTADVSILIDPSSGVPTILHWGAPLGPVDNADQVALSQSFPITHGALDSVAPLSLLPEHGTAFHGRPGIEGHRSGGAGWAPRFGLSSTATGADEISTWARIVAVDPHEQLEVTSDIHLQLASGVVRTRVTVRNTAEGAYQLAAVRQTLPLPSNAREVLTFGGRWTKEFIELRQPLLTGSVTIENRSGRTSHGRVPTAFAGTTGFSNDRGEIRAVHLEWSGNSFVSADALLDGRRCMQAAELLLPGEIVLESGESYVSPWACWSWSDEGTNGASQRFHNELRSRPNHPSTPRPVTLNIWEAVYFDHQLDRLVGLAEAAAAIGVERFVIDDGWFHLRRHDRAGLGDWWIDPDVWPNGLTPIADKVTELGMELGLWFEPEMVNPDSDLFRAHPEWLLVDQRYEPVMGRTQLVLDLGRPEVRDYLFNQMSAVLGAYPISYVKWDHNREIIHGATIGGQAGVHQQTEGFYDLLRRLREAHPTVEIESCSSGGGRIDFKVLDYCHRFWASDCNDALERQSIQRGFGYVFPPEYMGAHIGGEKSHTTQRKQSLAFRMATAFFGHLGIEWNILNATDDERAALAEAITAHKTHRGLLHSGKAIRLDHDNPSIVAHGVIALDQSEALISVATLASTDSLIIERLQVPGLAPEQTYRVAVLALGGGITGASRVQTQWMTASEPLTLTGRQLAVLGVQPPPLNPEQALLLHLSAV
jgi:alpha-galactosidase